MLKDAKRCASLVKALEVKHKVVKNLCSGQIRVRSVKSLEKRVKLSIQSNNTV